MIIYIKCKEIFVNVLLVGILCFTGIVYSQDTKGTQLSDNTVTILGEKLLDFSILDLNSKDKGFLLPRLTTEQRNTIGINELEKGLMIYNTSIDCIEFYHDSRNSWMSLCGDINPAIFVIEEERCEKIQIVGDYSVDAFLVPRENSIILEVTVSKAGTYQIEAFAEHSDGTPNGYSFSAKGVFPDIGKYTVMLKGSGTPTKGYERNMDGMPAERGDEISFTFNGKEVECKAYVFVDIAPLKYLVDRVEPKGQFFVEVETMSPLSKGQLEATISQISTPGVIRLFTETVNGIKFLGEKIVTASDVNKGTIVIELNGEGAPVIPIDTDFLVQSNTYVAADKGESPILTPVTVVIEQVAFDILCDSDEYPIIKEGVWKYNEALKDDNMISIPIKVKAPGKARIKGIVEINGQGYGKQQEKIELISETIDVKFNSESNNIQYVDLKPIANTGKPTINGGNMVVVLSGESMGSREYGIEYPIQNIMMAACDYQLPVEAIPVRYEILFNRSRIGGKLHPYKKATVANTVTLPIHVLLPGEAIIETTSAVNGITYKGQRLLTDLDVGKVVEVMLYATGVPEVANNYDVEFLGNSIGNAEQIGNIRIPMLYRPMRILAVGSSSSYQLTARNKAGLLNNKDYFGPEGIVKIESLEVINSTNTRADAFLTELNTNKIDIVVSGYNFRFDNVKNQYLYNFIANKKGAALIGNEASPREAADFINLLAGGGNASISTLSTFHTLANINEPILNGPFEKLQGKVLGEDRAGRTVNNLPNAYTRYDADPTKTWVFKHKEHAFVYIADSGFMSDSNVYGAFGNANSAVLIPGSGSADDRTLPTYNSHFTLNFLAWAIDYIQKNYKDDYIVN